MTVYIRGINLAGISCPARPANYFCSAPARLGINILQSLYNILNIFFGGKRQKLKKILLSMRIICDLISGQSQTCWILKTKY